MVIQSGHGSETWNYDWSLFKTAIATVDKLSKNNALSVMAGIGLAFSTEKNAVGKFLNG